MTEQGVPVSVEITPRGQRMIERQLQEERDRWDDDDRKPCVCTDHHRSLWGTGAIAGDGRCLKVTRHPTQKCGDCRAPGEWPIDHAGGE